MIGVKHSSKSDIQKINQVLGHYSEGFAFIKELIQNADDADAWRISLFWHQGLKEEADHPLLNGPALVAVNNGPFDVKHRDGIIELGLGTKASDNHKIGRFGLGMKAVFHVCEAFFFLESEGRDELRALFTPWYPDFHQEWDKEFPDDWHILHREVEQKTADWKTKLHEVHQETSSCQRWFAIWIPLRREVHCGIEGAIRIGNDPYPGDHKEECPPSLGKLFEESAPRLGETLLFLNKIEQIDFYDGVRVQTITHSRAQCTISHGSKYYRLNGGIRTNVEIEWKNKPAWPKVFANGDGEVTGRDKDKALWESSVVVSVNRDSHTSGHLCLFWAVFLPVGDKPCLDVILPEWDVDLHIFLHGYFFLEESRTSVYGVENAFEDADETTDHGIRIAWNKALATSEDGLLPLVIPALEDCFKGESFDDYRINQIVLALRDSVWFGTHRKSVAKKCRFGRFLRKGEWSWCSLPEATCILLMPLCGFTEEAAEKTLSQLLAKPGGMIFALESSPTLSVLEPDVRWTKADLDKLCKLLSDKEIAHESEARLYLREFFADKRIPIIESNTWKNLSIYEVRKIGETDIRVVTANAIDKLISLGQMFRRGVAVLESNLGKSCPNLVAWFIASGMPPTSIIPELNNTYAATLIIKAEVLGIASDRLPIVKLLVSILPDPSSVLAIRYLLHGSWANASDTVSKLLFQDGDWKDPVQPLLEAIQRTWSWVDPMFQGDLTENQMEQLQVHKVGVMDFRELCEIREILPMLPDLGLHQFHDFLLSNLETQEDHNLLLRKLPIHRYGESGYTDVTDGVWLAPAQIPVVHNLVLWNNLRSQAKIVERCTPPQLALLQEQVFEEKILDRNGIMRLATVQAEPSHYAELILECLAQGTPTQETAAALQLSAWLPIRGGESCKPKQLIWLKNAEEEIDRVTAQLPKAGGWVTRSQLAIDWEPEKSKISWRNDGWGTMANPSNPLIPAGNRLVESLRTPVAETCSLHFGIAVANREEVGRWLEAVAGIEADLSSATGLVRKLFNAGEIETPESPRWMVDLSLLFFIPWQDSETPRYDHVMEALRQSHAEVGAPQKKQIEACFDLYLSTAKQASRWDSHYRLDEEFTLLSQSGQWTQITQLAFGIPGISKSCLLNQSSAQALGLAPKSAVSNTAPPHDGAIVAINEELQDLLTAYAEQLGESLSSRHWGLFLVILGPNVRDLAPKFLEDTVDVDNIRINLVGPDHSPARIKLVQCIYECEIVVGNVVTLTSIHGSCFDANREVRDASLLVPQPDAQSGTNRHFLIESTATGYKVSFKLLHPDSLASPTPQELRSCIERTIQIHQVEVLGVPPEIVWEVSRIMDVVQKLDQLDLGIAQQEMLGAARFQLSQLCFSAAPGSELAAALQMLDDADRLKAQSREEKLHAVGDWESSENSGRLKEEEGLTELRSILTGDQGLQIQLAEAMAGRIEDEQYRADSIPFELFQNADDAYLELPRGQQVEPVFIVDFNGNQARFAHSGRPINQPSDPEPEVARKHKRDLVKMLMLHGSDKTRSIGEGQTGKFGLGFKSVFLACVRPEILSAHLGVQIVGAFYPQRLPIVAREELKSWLSQNLPDPKHATAIRIPFADVASDVVSARFSRLAAYLPVFAKAIREIRISDGPSHSWNPEKLHVVDDWRLLEGDIRIGERTVKIFQISGQRLSWVFGRQLNRLSPLPNLPCLWITAPTLEDDDLGFALNGPFDPDPGRSRLTTSSGGNTHNNYLFCEAANLLYQFLLWCRKAPDIAQSLDFWTSVWELFSKPSVPSGLHDAKARLLKAIWADGSGYRHIIESEPVIPNGLPDGLHMLTSTAVIRFETKGFIDSKAGLSLLAEAFEWQELVNADAELRINSQEIVSAKVALLLRTRLQWDEPRPALSLPFLLRRLVGMESRVAAALCGKLGAHLNMAALFPDKPRNGIYDWPSEEKALLFDFIRGLHFRSRSGSWTKAEDLLVSAATGIESMRAGFAPPERVLHTDYDAEENADDFFRLCRGEMKVTSPELSLWLQESAKTTDSKRRFNALLFLASQDPFVAEAAGGLSEACKEALVKSPEFAGLSQENQNRVNNAFQGARLQQAQKEGRLFEPDPVFHDDDPDEDFEPAIIVTAEDLIREWNLDEALNLFTISGPLREVVTPGAMNDKQACKILLDTKGIDGRGAWYRLLCLGCTLSIPRGRRPASDVAHIWNGNLGKDFWEHTIPASMADLAKDSFKSKLDAFFKSVVDRYYTSENATGEDAEFWRRVFYDFRKMHHFVFHNQLPETVLEFAESPEADGERLNKFLRSGHIPDEMKDPNYRLFRGVVAQSMKAPLLFMMRELRRLEVIDNRFDGACYYMNSPARRIARQLGWLGDETRYAGDFSDLVDQSEIVHRRMQDEIPELVGHFDLPLQLYAHKHPR